MTLQQFTEIFALLAVQLRFSDADEATIRGYFKALSDIEPELIAMAAQRFAQGDSLNDQGQAWFPKAPEWRALAFKIKTQRQDEQRAILRKLADPLCLACRDTGFALNGETNRVRRCDCAELRRLEILGRRPMPILPAHEPTSDSTQLARVTAMAADQVKGMR